MAQIPVTGQSAIPFATDEHGGPVEWRLESTAEPHMFLTGAPGAGTSSTARVIAAGAARLGLDVRFCDPKPGGAGELAGMPGITVAANVPGTARLIGDTWADMMQRYEQMEAGTARAGGFPPDRADHRSFRNPGGRSRRHSPGRSRPCARPARPFAYDQPGRLDQCPARRRGLPRCSRLGLDGAGAVRHQGGARPSRLGHQPAVVR